MPTKYIVRRNGVPIAKRIGKAARTYSHVVYVDVPSRSNVIPFTDGPLPRPAGPFVGRIIHWCSRPDRAERMAHYARLYFRVVEILPVEKEA